MYDGSDRITSMVSSSNPGDKFVYTYPSENTVWSELYVGGALGIHYEAYYKNNNIDSAFQYNNSGDSSTEKYIYNSSGYFIKSYEYNYSKAGGATLENTINNTYDAAGNQLKAEDTDTNVETFEYYTDKVYISADRAGGTTGYKKKPLKIAHTYSQRFCWRHRHVYLYI